MRLCASEPTAETHTFTSGGGREGGEEEKNWNGRENRVAVSRWIRESNGLERVFRV